MGRHGVRIALVALPLEPGLEPLGALEALRDLPCSLLLDGAAAHDGQGRYSYLMADPVELVRAGDGATRDILARLRTLLGPRRPPAAGLPPFQGGLAGYLGYEFGRAFERVPAPADHGAGTPDVLLGLYDWVVAWDHALGAAWLLAADFGRPRQSARLLELQRRLDATRRPRPTPVPPPEPRDAGTAPPPSDFSRDDYMAAVARVREYILAGDVFQVNLSQRFRLPAPDDPLAIYRRLRALTPASHAAWFDAGDHVVLSASPERFLRVEGRRIDTRPIKGTRPRGRTPAEDDALRAELLASAKDRAENVMIVDLMRNDLSRVAEPGSVEVPRLAEHEAHPTVHHLVSTVTATLRPECDALDLLAAAFPGGSITGAPKVRAMEIIAELEPVRRGVYCGSLGYLAPSGDMELSIAIRTIVLRDGTAHLHAGGGIVAASDPAEEYDETLAKAKALIGAVRG